MGCLTPDGHIKEVVGPFDAQFVEEAMWMHPAAASRRLGAAPAHAPAPLGQDQSVAPRRDPLPPPPGSLPPQAGRATSRAKRSRRRP